MLIPEDLNVGASDDSECMTFVFLSLGYLIQHNFSGSTHSPTNFIISFFLAPELSFIVYISTFFLSINQFRGISVVSISWLL